jgi:DNA-binding MarR family transcriptional regulator
VPHFTVLNHLMRVEDGRTPLELARAFQVPKTTLPLAGGAGEARWVEMKPNPDDGRSKRVWLTDAGRAFREEAIAEPSRPTSPARCAPSARPFTKPSTSSTGLPSAISDTMAEPTTQPSATPAIASAASGVLMPKPTITGRSVAP